MCDFLGDFETLWTHSKVHLTYLTQPFLTQRLKKARKLNEKGQKLVENAKIEKLICDILGDFQTLWTCQNCF